VKGKYVPKPKPKPHPVYGFDTCAAPSLATMRTWRRGFSVAGVYIGGVNAVCGLGWISTPTGSKARWRGELISVRVPLRRLIS
jgi:hypothetical protein